VILTLVTDDVDGWHERFIAAGVTSEKPPQHNPTFNIYHCFLRDPNGYLLEIQRFEDPA
jgi:catechol 2,3-dioxygenase-like lactoylglutathione lyase family enzyme